MLLKAYTVYDMKVEAYMRPWYCLTDGEAVRTFGDAVNDPESAFHKHPDDFTLYGIGTFDDLLGVLDSTTHVNLGCALQYIIKAQPHAKPIGDEPSLQ